MDLTNVEDVASTIAKIDMKVYSPETSNFPFRTFYLCMAWE